MAVLTQDEWVLTQHTSLFGGGKGYYLDIGARDGEQISNTYALDKHGWEVPANRHVFVLSHHRHTAQRSCCPPSITLQNFLPTL